MQKLGRFLLAIIGWKATGGIPKEFNNYILIAAPHTSNFDFILALPTMWALKMKARYLIKKEVFVPGFAWFLKATGGIPVDRKNGTKEFVDSLKKMISGARGFGLIFAPEGTRSWTPKWKTGFYRIAVELNLPIIMAKADYKKKTVDVSDFFYPTGDMEEDFKYMEEAFVGVTPCYPEKWNPKIIELGE